MTFGADELLVASWRADGDMSVKVLKDVFAVCGRELEARREFRRSQRRAAATVSRLPLQLEVHSAYSPQQIQLERSGTRVRVVLELLASL